MNNLFPILFFLFFPSLFHKSFSAPNENEKFTACSKKLKCGALGDGIGYPFYDGYYRPDYCRYPGFQLYNCEATPLITISGNNYSVSSIRFGEYRITVHRNDKWSNFCPDDLLNTTMDYSKFNFSASDKNITFFYHCDLTSHDLSELELTTNCVNVSGNPILRGYYVTQEMLDDGYTFMFEICNSNLFLPIIQQPGDNGPGDLDDVIKAFGSGFELGYMAENEACVRCMDSGGFCGWSLPNEFVCHCPDGDYYHECPKNGNGNYTNKPRFLASFA